MRLSRVAKVTVYCEPVKEVVYPGAFLGLIMGTYTVGLIIGLLFVVASLDLCHGNLSIAPPVWSKEAATKAFSLTTRKDSEQEKVVLK